MKCTCGGKMRIKETRGNDYITYRIRKCKECGNEAVTQETKMDYKEGKKMIRKIFYIRYLKKAIEKDMKNT